MEIIIRGKARFGRNRSEQEQNLRKEWGSTMSDEALDKIKHLEKKSKEITGSDAVPFGQIDTGQVK